MAMRVTGPSCWTVWLVERARQPVIAFVLVEKLRYAAARIDRPASVRRNRDAEPATVTSPASTSLMPAN
jgi:hypothetical protein